MRVKQLFVLLPFQMKFTSFFALILSNRERMIRYVLEANLVFLFCVWLFDCDMAVRHAIKTCAKTYYQFVHIRNVLVRAKATVGTTQKIVTIRAEVCQNETN